MKHPNGHLLIADSVLAGRTELGQSLLEKGLNFSIISPSDSIFSSINQYDSQILILNSDMVKSSEMDVLRTFRSEYDHLALPIIVVNHGLSPNEVVSTFEAGASDVITVDLGTPDLINRITPWVRQQVDTAKLKQQEERYRLALECSSEHVWDWNVENDYLFFTPGLEALIGFESGEFNFSSQSWFDKVHPSDSEQLIQAINNHLEGNTEQLDHKYRVVMKEQGNRWIHLKGQVTRQTSSNNTRVIGIQQDITNQTIQDALTGLPNQVIFMDRLEREFERAQRNPENLFAVLYVDIDNFKEINNSFNFETGNELVRAIVHRLQQNLRLTDTVSHCLFSHFVADEFPVLLIEMNDINDAVKVSLRIQQALEKLFHIKGQEIFITASIGIAPYQETYANPEDILRDASVAVSRAKELGKGRIEIFDPQMQSFSKKRLRLESDLRRAIEENQFSVYYQPIVCLETEQTRRLEALVRWQHPDRGIIPPAEFLPLAEEVGLMAEIDRCVLHQACYQFKAWLMTFPEAKGIKIGVNLSNQQLMRADFFDFLTQLLLELGLDSEYLDLEITESAYIEHKKEAVRLFERLRELNIDLSLDDFGTGFSSLSYLNEFVTDSLKIDRSFVQRIEYDSKTKDIMSAIISLAKNLDMLVIAEGIEHKEQIDILKSLGCEYGQGYFFSKPLDADAMFDYLQKEFKST